MKRVFLAMLCGAALIAGSVAYAGDAVSDKEMADRYSQAAQSGDSDAQFYLAALYSSGVGRPRSDEEAFRWFSRAADQGHSHAMLVLSGIYAVGRGIQKDNFNAYKWAYIVSVGSRVDEFRNGSRQLMGVLETRMTRDDVDRAKAEAGRWHATSSQPKSPISFGRFMIAASARWRITFAATSDPPIAGASNRSTTIGPHLNDASASSTIPQPASPQNPRKSAPAGLMKKNSCA